MSTNSISAWVLGHGSDNLVCVLLQRCWILFAVCALMNVIEVLPQLVPAVAPLSILFGCGSTGILHKWLSLIQCWDPRGSCKQLPGALHLLWSWAGFSKSVRWVLQVIAVLQHWSSSQGLTAKQDCLHSLTENNSMLAVHAKWKPLLATQAQGGHE